VVMKIRQIGNSRGVILPAPYLNALRVEHELEMRLEGDKIILEAPSVLRENWFRGYLAGDVAEPDSSEWDAAGSLSSDEDWEW